MGVVELAPIKSSSGSDMGGQVWPADRDTDVSDAQPMIVGVYSRREARAVASVLMGELWPWPGSTPEFRELNRG